ncbi:hypothetical protein HK102_000614 [Quaeritorhiza haematococci]|nr:hypothetical protein HK102_000614 [Quaeritorhiza haematococci]
MKSDMESLARQNSISESSKLRFERYVPNFVSMHVRAYCDEIKRQKLQQQKPEPIDEEQEKGSSNNVLDTREDGRDVSPDMSTSFASMSMEPTASSDSSSSSQQQPPDPSSLPPLPVKDVTFAPGTPSRRNTTVLAPSANDWLKPVAMETFAAVVMVDVSGYSSLTATLAEKGAVGAELLSRTMKQYFDKIIEIIILHGGDIVKFVAHCCLDILNQLDNHMIDIPDCNIKELRIHLGIGAGQIFDVHVGDSDRWEHFIAGDAMNQLAAVLNLAQPGELAMSHQALQFFSCIVDIASVTIGAYDKRCIILNGLEKARRKPRNGSTSSPKKEDSNEDDGNSLSTYMTKKGMGGSPVNLQYPAANRRSSTAVPPMHHEHSKMAAVDLYKVFINHSALFKLQTDINQSRLFQYDGGFGQIMACNELRQVTTLFIRVGTIQRWDAKVTLQAAQEALTVVQTALRRYEGSLRQFHVDDKGAVILCFFGLPPLAHENDASFGVKAALEIWNKYTALIGDFAIGITTGVVSIGGVGNGVRTEYAVMGDSINMAARLMCLQQARSSLLCDEKTYNLTEREFIYEKLEEQKVKGKSHPIAVFRPKRLRINGRQPHTAANRNLDIIGREKEKQALTTALQSQNTVGGSRILIIEADGGQGLSTLIEYFKHEAYRLGFHLCTGSASEMEKTTRAFVFREIICDLLEIPQTGKECDSDEKKTLHSLMFRMNRGDSGSMDFNEFFSSPSTAVPPRQPGQFATWGRPTTEHTQPQQEATSPISNYAADTTDIGTSRMLQPPSPNLPRAEAWLSRRSSHGILSSENTRKKATPVDWADGSFIGTTNNSNLESSHTEALPGPSRKRMTPEMLFEDKIKQALIRFNESPFQAPILDVVFPMVFQQNDITIPLQGKIRTKELADLLRRIINYLIMEGRSVVITLDEAQWMDATAWELLWDLANACPKIMICVFSRPERHYEDDDTRLQYMKFKKHPKAETMIIGGLDLQATGQMIIQCWAAGGGERAKSVSKRIIENIHKKTNGNPLFIRSSITALRESGHCRVTEDGELKLARDDFDFERGLGIGEDLSSIIVAQMDRLDRGFQIFLKVASILGQRFQVYDALFFIVDTPGFSAFWAGTFDELGQKKNKAIFQVVANIEKMDRYGFLRKLDSGDAEDGAFLEFTSGVVRKCIYSMLVQSQRQQLHLSVAKYYERMLNESNRHRLLVPIYEHYAETDERQIRKKLHYLEEVAHMHYEKHSMQEAMKHYNLLLEHAERAQMQNPNTVLFDTATKCRWHLELGDTYFIRKEDSKAEYHMLECLKYAGHAFPKSRWRLKMSIRKNLYTRKRHNVTAASPRGGRREFTSTMGSTSSQTDLDEFPHNQASSSAGKEDLVMVTRTDQSTTTNDAKRLTKTTSLSKAVKDHSAGRGSDSSVSTEQHARFAYLVLSVIYLRKCREKEHIYTVLRGLKISESFPPDALHARLLAMYTNVLWFKTRETQIRSSILDMISMVDKYDWRTNVGHTTGIITSTAVTLFMIGYASRAMRRYKTLESLGSICGDVSLQTEAMRMHALIIHLGGLRTRSLQIGKDLYSLGQQLDDWWSKFSGMSIVVSNLLTMSNNDTELVNVTTSFRNLWQQITENSAIDANTQLTYNCLMFALDIRLGLGLSLTAMLEDNGHLLVEAGKQFKSPRVEDKLMTKSAADDVGSDEHSGRSVTNDSAGWLRPSLPILGLLHLSTALLRAWEAGLVDKPVDQRRFVNFCQIVERFLGSKHVSYVTVNLHLRFLYKGLRILVAKHKSKSRGQLNSNSPVLVEWYKGLSMPTIKDLLYLQALFHSHISRYMKSGEKHAKQAQTLFKKVGATYDYEKLSS